MAQEEASLRELCSICYTDKSKYRCPRCKTRTCSLPCYKRHQQRARCNGERDPAAFIKKSQLATPAGVDRDYNYLRGIERKIEHANRDTHERGIGAKPGLDRIFARGINPEGSVQRYLITNRINVARAPRGMHRQRSNKTRWTKRGHIMWTVEWMTDRGSRDLHDGCLASSNLQELYDLMCLERKNAIKRGLITEGPPGQSPGVNPKRRRIGSSKAKSPDQPPAAQSEGTDSNTDLQVSASTETPTSPSGDDISQIRSDTDADKASQQSELKSSTPDPDLKSDTMSDQNSAPSSERNFFYLLKPNTPSQLTVLIPLSSDATLTDSLRDRTVLEYPTLYVLPQDSTSLPLGFMTEEDFLADQEQEKEEFNDAVKKAQKSGILAPAAQHLAPTSAAKPVDPQRILEMLKRDISG